MSSYDAIAELYDPWSASVVEDVAFYLEEARASGGPVVELGVGTGRIAVPIAADGIRVIGVDSSRGMLDVCARRAALAGVELDLRLGDLREPPVSERVPLVICPFRSLLHMHTDEDREAVLRAAHELLLPGGRFVFDVFAPDADDIAQTQGAGSSASRESSSTLSGTSMRARSPSRCVTASARRRWHSPGSHPRSGRRSSSGRDIEIEACYGWFDRTPYAGREDTVWVARRRG